MADGAPTHARRATWATVRAVRAIGRWESVELDLVRMATAALGIAVPFGWGLVTGHVGEGAAATIGALLVSASGHVGSLTDRVKDLLLGTTVSAIALILGSALDHRAIVTVLVIPVVAGLLALIGPVRPAVAKATMQGTVALVLSTSLAPPGAPVGTIVAWFVVGAMYAGVLTLVGHWLAGRITHTRGDPEGRRSWRTDLRTWLGRTRTVALWDYPLDLTVCLCVAELAAHSASEQHSTWIVLTVVLVMQRDRRSAIGRTVQRGLGTAVGVGLGALMLVAFPEWLLIAVIAVIGAVRGHLKIANYAAYTVVMTPLVMVFLGAGRPTPSSLLAERLIDTGIGCLIALLVGQFLWPRVMFFLERKKGAA